MDDDQQESMRFTVALTRDAGEAMKLLRERTGFNKTDIINRALVVYLFVDDEVRAGKELILRDKDGNQERVKII